MRYSLHILDRDGLPPCAAITIGKLEFRRYTKVRSADPDLPDLTHMGAVGEYSEQDLAEFSQAVSRLVVRWQQREHQGKMRLRAAQIFDTEIAKAGAYQKDAADEPLLNYLRIVPVGPDAAPVTIGVGAAAPEQLDAAASAHRSEQIARQDPADARTRATHGRAKARGESVSGDPTS